MNIIIIIIIIGIFQIKHVVRHTFLRTHNRALVQSVGSRMPPIVRHVTSLFNALQCIYT